MSYPKRGSYLQFIRQLSFVHSALPVIGAAVFFYISICASVWADVVISDAYVATPIPGTHLTAIYGKFQNDTPQDIQIVALKTDSSRATELHEQEIYNGDIVRMRPIKTIIIPAHTTLILHKGGKHLMLINLSRELHDHDWVLLTLFFSRGHSQQVYIPVLRSKEQLSHEIY